MPGHFLGLRGANTLVTSQYQLSARIVDDLVAHAATGVIHGPAGVGRAANQGLVAFQGALAEVPIGSWVGPHGYEPGTKPPATVLEVPSRNGEQR
jgi:hypothetical protein